MGELGGQGTKKGVARGWKITKVNDEEYSQSLLWNYKDGTEGYIITFEYELNKHRNSVSDGSAGLSRNRSKSTRDQSIFQNEQCLTELMEDEKWSDLAKFVGSIHLLTVSDKDREELISLVHRIQNKADTDSEQEFDAHYGKSLDQ